MTVQLMFTVESDWAFYRMIYFSFKFIRTISGSKYTRARPIKPQGITLFISMFPKINNFR